jgi:hypothetical protein
MQAAVMDPVRTEPAMLDLPDPLDVLYPDFQFSAPIEAGSAPSTAFVVDTAAKADWTIGRVLGIEARMGRRAELAAELHSRVDAWLTKAQAPDQDSVDYLTGLLRPYVEAELALQRRSRTLSLPSGAAGLRRRPDRLELIDREAALAWCEEHAVEAVIVKKDLSKTELKKLVFERGEAVPGVDAALGSDELWIKARA